MLPTSPAPDRHYQHLSQNQCKVMKNNHDGVRICAMSEFIKYFLLMKLAAFLILFFSFQSFAYNTYSQKTITIELKNVSITRAFKAIEEQGDYRFVYSDEIIPKSKYVSIYAKEATFASVLRKILEGTTLSYELKGEKLVIIKESSPSHLMKGKVIDEKGLPISGVSIIEKGTSNGTITATDGSFLLNVKDQNAILALSMVGYESKEIQVRGNYDATITLKLTDSKLDEVVIIGYGQATRKTLSTAQTTISAKDIEKTVNTTFDQALQGRSAGVVVTTNSAQPGGGLSVNIRGISTLGGTTDPLYVIDGVQTQPGITGYNNSSSLNPLAQLNPTDIENIEILQGPSAAAIFGSRATNGVVIVTTKRGKTGDTKINYDLLYTLQDTPKEIPVLDLKEWVIMNNQLRRFKNNAIPLNQTDSSILGLGTNWQRAIFRRAPIAKHQLSVSGGNEKTTFYLSAERFDQQGVVRGSGFNRTGIRLNLDNQTKKWLKIGLNINANQTNDDVNTTVNNSINYAFSLPPYIPVYNADGTYGGFSTLEGGNRADQLNPFAKADLMTNTQKRNNLNGGFNATLFLLKGLQFRTSLNASYNNTTTVDFTPTYHIGVSYVDAAVLNERNSNNYYYNWNQLLEYRTKIKEAHDVTLMVSHESQESRSQGLTGQRTGFPVNELPGGQIPGINLGDAIGQVVGGWKGWWAQESYLGRLSYNYKNKYFATFSYRGDGSVNFGENNRWGFFPAGSFAWRVSEEKFIKNSTTIISDLKLRFETGTTGNQGSIAGVYAALRAVPSPWGNGFLVNRYKNPDLKWESTYTNNFGFNLGLWNDRLSIEGDYYIRNTDNLLMPNQLPYYMGTAGAGAIEPPIVNLGALQNKGWAFTLRSINISGKDFRWTSNFNISHNKTKINKFYQETAVFDMTNWRAGGGFIQRSAVGNEAWQFWGYKSDGIFKTIEEVKNSPVPQNGTIRERLPLGYNGVFIGDYKYKDINNDSLINPMDMTYIGNPYPRYTFGFTNEFNWKNLSLSVIVIGSQGNQVYNAFRYNYLDPFRVFNYYNVLKESYQGYARIAYDEFNEPYLINPDATVPRIEGQNGNWSRASDRFVEDASYVRIKNLTLSYQIPQLLLDRLKIIRSLRLSIGVQNLYTFTKYTGYDPEIGVDIGQGSDVQRRTFGVDVGQYPQTRSYIFNLNLGL